MTPLEWGLCISGIGTGMAGASLAQVMTAKAIKMRGTKSEANPLMRSLYEKAESNPRLRWLPILPVFILLAYLGVMLVVFPVPAFDILACLFYGAFNLWDGIHDYLVIRRWKAGKPQVPRSIPRFMLELVALGVALDALTTIAYIEVFGPASWLATETGNVRFFWPSQGFYAFATWSPYEFCFFLTFGLFTTWVAKNKRGRKWTLVRYAPVFVLYSAPLTNFLFLVWRLATA